MTQSSVYEGSSNRKEVAHCISKIGLMSTELLTFLFLSSELHYLEKNTETDFGLFSLLKNHE
jgi:hypothetical protein